jgi:hypothetical protein
MNFLSMLWPPLAKASAISIFVIEPNNFPPAFAKILISIAFKASANFASATFSFFMRSLFRFSANTFFADEVS